MSNFFKNKKVLISIISILIIAILIGGSIFLFKGNKKDTEKNNQNSTSNYVAYIKINPSIKLEYQQICKNDKCDEPIVLKYELINDDAKNIFKDVDLLQNDKTLYKVIDLITETTKNNNIKFDKVEIYSDWNNAQAYINKNSNNIYKVSINTNDELNKISNLLIKNEDIPDEMFVPSKDELPEGAHYATKEEAKKYGVAEGTIIYPEQSMTGNTDKKELTEEEINAEYEKFYGNKNQQEQKPSTNSNSGETKEELTPNKEIAPGLYQEAGYGYGDYVKGDHVSLVPGGRRYFKFISTSKLGCADAIDKSACKKSWMDYFAPKLETVKEEYFHMKNSYDAYYPVEYEKEMKKLQDKVNYYKEAIALCETNPEEAATKYYYDICNDAPGYLKYNEDRLKQDPINKANIENDLEAARYHYEEHLTAYNIYKNLPY